MKKFRNLVTLALLFCLILQLVFVGFVSAEQSIDISSPVFKKTIDGVDTLIPKPEVGFIKTEINVKNNKSAETSCTLVAALYNDAENKLERVSFETSTIPGFESRTLSSGIQVDSLDGYSYKYYLWNSLDKMTPNNIPPAIPAGFRMAHSTNRSMVLAWEKPQSSTDIKDYIIYRDNEQIARTDEVRCTDTFLTDNTEYTYKVAATDVLGSVSEESEITARTAIMPNSIVATPPQNEKLTFVLTDNWDIGDSYTVADSKNGVPCRKAFIYNRGDKDRQGMHYFKVNNNYITSDDTNITFEITYFDEGTADLVIQYNAVDGNVAKPAPAIKRTNTNMWKTGVVSITDAKFVKPSTLQNSDFRICSKGDSYISKAAVARTDEYFSNAAKATLGTYDETYRMAYIRGTNEPAAIGDAQCGKAPTGNSFTFGVDDNYIKPTDNKVEIELSYYDLGTDTLCLEYNNTSSQITGAEIPMTGTNTWIKKRIAITDANFSNAINGGDFSIGLKAAGNSLYIKDVAVYKHIYQKVDAILGENGIYNGLTIFDLENEKADGYNTVTVKGAKECRYAASNKNIYFRIDDDYIFGSKYNNATITFDYFDEGNGSIELHYNSSDPNLAEGVKRDYKGIIAGFKTNTMEWKTMSVTINDAAFANKQGAGYYNGDFKLTGKDDLGLCLSYVKVVAGDITHVNKIAKPTIYLAGDSTCESLPETWYPREGWGMELGQYFNSDVTINNQAKGGKSTKTFISEGKLNSILELSKQGDYLFIQFGHNDSVIDAADNRYTSPTSTEQNDSSYKYNLTRFVTLARENGMIPVFLTSIFQYKFDVAGNLSTDDGLNAYRNAMIELGQQLNVPTFDIGTKHRTMLEQWGSEASKQLFLFFDYAQYPDYPTTNPLPDKVHISQTAANEISKFIVNDVKASSQLKTLASYIDNTKDTTPIEAPVK